MCVYHVKLLGHFEDDHDVLRLLLHLVSEFPLQHRLVPTPSLATSPGHNPRTETQPTRSKRTSFPPSSTSENNKFFNYYEMTLKNK